MPMQAPAYPDDLIQREVHAFLEFRLTSGRQSRPIIQRGLKASLGAVDHFNSYESLDIRFTEEPIEGLWSATVLSFDDQE